MTAINLCRFNAVSSGIAAFVVASAAPGCLTPGQALAINAKTYFYMARFGLQWEYGSGGWTNGSNTLARTTITATSNKNSLPVNFSSPPVVDVFPSPVATLDVQPFPFIQILRGYIDGLILSPIGTNTFGIAPGLATDGTGSNYMALPSAWTKTTAAWAVGSGHGSLDTSSIAASTWYHVHLIQRLDTLAVDILVSLSATLPTMPPNYTSARRIGSIKTNGSSNWIGYNQNGDEISWLSPPVDVNSTVGSGAFNYALGGLPPNVQVNARIQVFVNGGTVGTSVAVFNGATVATGFGMIFSSAQVAGEMYVQTASPQNVTINVASGGPLLVNTVGYVDPRGKNN